MSTDRHRAILETSELYADAARDAEEKGQHARAALLYWAAAMVLDGHSVEEVRMMLEERSAFTSMRLGRDLARPLPIASDGSQPGSAKLGCRIAEQLNRLRRRWCVGTLTSNGSDSPSRNEWLMPSR
jgi:hypothetical protein